MKTGAKWKKIFINQDGLIDRLEFLKVMTPGWESSFQMKGWYLCVSKNYKSCGGKLWLFTVKTFLNRLWQVFLGGEKEVRVGVTPKWKMKNWLKTKNFFFCFYPTSYFRHAISEKDSLVVSIGLFYIEWNLNNKCHFKMVAITWLKYKQQQQHCIHVT